MKLAYDLHIHSVLSACAKKEMMTPNNILSMAMLRQLDILAVTDHNTTKQLPTIFEIGESYDFLIVPGIEVKVKERFDVLCYFRTLDVAMKFDSILDKYRVKRDYDRNRLAQQRVTNIYDETVDVIEYLIYEPLSLDFDSLINIVKELDGLVIPAHVDKYNNHVYFTEHYSSILDAYECNNLNSDIYKEIKDKYKIITNSDSHNIHELNGRINYLDLEEKSIDAFFNYFKKK